MKINYWRHKMLSEIAKKYREILSNKKSKITTLSEVKVKETCALHIDMTIDMINSILIIREYTKKGLYKDVKKVLKSIRYVNYVLEVINRQLKLIDKFRSYLNTKINRPVLLSAKIMEDVYNELSALIKAMEQLVEEYELYLKGNKETAFALTVSNDPNVALNANIRDKVVMVIEDLEDIMKYELPDLAKKCNMKNL